MTKKKDSAVGRHDWPGSTPPDLAAIFAHAASLDRVTAQAELDEHLREGRERSVMVRALQARLAEPDAPRRRRPVDEIDDPPHEQVAGLWCAEKICDGQFRDQRGLMKHPAALLLGSLVYASIWLAASWLI